MELKERDIKMSENNYLPIYYGEVIWFNNSLGYGFILWEKDREQQKDLFAHFSDIVSEGFKTLCKGQRVTFQLGTNKNGDPKAINIQVLKNPIFSEK